MKIWFALNVPLRLKVWETLLTSLQSLSVSLSAAPDAPSDFPQPSEISSAPDESLAKKKHRLLAWFDWFLGQAKGILSAQDLLTKSLPTVASFEGALGLSNAKGLSEKIANAIASLPPTDLDPRVAQIFDGSSISNENQNSHS